MGLGKVDFIADSYLWVNILLLECLAPFLVLRGQFIVVQVGVMVMYTRTLTLTLSQGEREIRRPHYPNVLTKLFCPADGLHLTPSPSGRGLG
jgi:hypothetical protein